MRSRTGVRTPRTGIDAAFLEPPPLEGVRGTRDVRMKRPFRGSASGGGGRKSGRAAARVPGPTRYAARRSRGVPDRARSRSMVRRDGITTGAPTSAATAMMPIDFFLSKNAPPTLYTTRHPPTDSGARSRTAAQRRGPATKTGRRNSPNGRRAGEWRSTPSRVLYPAPSLEISPLHPAGRRVAYFFSAAATVSPRRPSSSTTVTPASRRAATLSSPRPLEPLMMAPACPMRLPAGAVRPAMKPKTGLG